VWRWLRRYWKYWLRGDVEIVIGYDYNTNRPFSKAAAVNDAARRARGDIFVILDSDVYMPASVVKHCAERIRVARKHGTRLWFVPYQFIYRLTPEATEHVLESSPKDPLRFTGHGHKFGAMITIMSREAFEFVGGMDERFRGWGGEDVSFLRAVDTLWARHKNTPNDVLHMWHPKLHIPGPKMNPKEPWKTRIWDGQDRARHNDWLAIMYNEATWKPLRMRVLVDTGLPLPFRPHRLRILFLRIFRRV
jgi:glycosyltransferase involved in cell wall biosynthesis